MVLFNWQEKIVDEELQQVKDVLDNDGLIIFPTDTVYGIACNCFSNIAIEKVFLAKKRQREKPINVLLNNKEKISLVANKITSKERTLIEKYMPGDLTIILEKKETVPDILTANKKTVGVRIPNNKIALKILEKLDYPLATTSVNISGEKPGIEVDNFLEEFQNKIDIIIDGGPSKIKMPSTIVKVENNQVKVLRQGNLKIES